MDHLGLQDGKNLSLWYDDGYSTGMERKSLLKEYRERFVTNKVNGVLPDDPHAAETPPDSWTGQKALDYLDTCRADQPPLHVGQLLRPPLSHGRPDEYMQRVDMDRDFPRRWREGEWDDETKRKCMGYFGTGPCSEGSANAVDHASKNDTGEYWRHWRQKDYANIVQIDEYIQRIIGNARGIWSHNLYIVFSAGHGIMMGNHSL